MIALATFYRLLEYCLKIAHGQGYELLRIALIFNKYCISYPNMNLYPAAI